jgi:hypothetical protein
MQNNNSRSLSRRSVLTAAGVTAAAAGLGLSSAAAEPRRGSAPVTRPLPDGGGRVPVIGLGSFMTFDRRLGTDQSFIPAVLEAFHDGGGRLVDTSALYGVSETNVGRYLRELGLTDEVLITDKSWACGEYLFDDSHVTAAT